MKTFIKTISILTALIVVMTLQSCELDIFQNDKIIPNLKKFDVDLFDQNLKIGLSTQWVGYAYTINQNGTMVKSGTFGKWAQGGDGNINADLTTNLYAASVSKMITAVAMLKAMDEHGPGASSMLNVSIQNFLPPIWQVDGVIGQNSFGELLRHRSGIASSFGPDYNSLKSAVATTPVNKNYAYSNANYGLMRILIHKLVTKQNLLGTDEEIDAQAQATFEWYVEENLFKPLGIKASLRPSKARYYRWGDQAITAGWNIGSRPERLGSGAWYISPEDLAKFLAYLNNSEQLLKKETRALMYNQFLGWSDGAAPTNTPSGEHGIYYAKGGSFCNSGTDNNCIGQGVRTLVVTFPNNVELVIMANNRGNNMSLTNLAFTSFDNAWQ